MQNNGNMLDESNRLMAQIKNSAKLKELQRGKRRYYFNLIKKWALRVLFVVSISCSLFFPVETGNIVGTWMHDFFGTIYKNIVK